MDDNGKENYVNIEKYSYNYYKIYIHSNKIIL